MTQCVSDLSETVTKYALTSMGRPALHNLGWEIQDSAWKKEHMPVLDEVFPLSRRKGSFTIEPEEWDGARRISKDVILAGAVRHALWAGNHRIRAYKELWQAGKDIAMMAFDDYPIFESDGTTKLTRRASKRLRKLGLDANSVVAQSYASTISAMVQATTEKVDLYYHISTKHEHMMLLGELAPDNLSCFGLAGENAHHTEVLHYGYPSFVVFVSIHPAVMDDSVVAIRHTTQFRMWGYVHPDPYTGEYIIVMSNPYNYTRVPMMRLANLLAKHIIPSEYSLVPNQMADISPNVWYNKKECVIATKELDIQPIQWTPYTGCPMCGTEEEWNTLHTVKSLMVHSVDSKRTSQEPFCSGHRQQVDDRLHQCIGCKETMIRQGTHGRRNIVTPCISSTGQRSWYGNRIYLCNDCLDTVPYFDTQPDTSDTIWHTFEGRDLLYVPALEEWDCSSIPTHQEKQGEQS